jgi:hypothetical protein
MDIYSPIKMGRIDFLKSKLFLWTTFKHPVIVSQKTYCVCIKKFNQLMMFK